MAGGESSYLGASSWFVACRFKALSLVFQLLPSWHQM